MDLFGKPVSFTPSAPMLKRAGIPLVCFICSRTDANGYKVCVNKQDGVMRCHACRLYLSNHAVERPALWGANMVTTRTTRTQKRLGIPKAGPKKIKTMPGGPPTLTPIPKAVRDASSQTGESGEKEEDITSGGAILEKRVRLGRKQTTPSKLERQ